MWRRSRWACWEERIVNKQSYTSTLKEIHVSLQSRLMFYLQSSFQLKKTGLLTSGIATMKARRAKNYRLQSLAAFFSNVTCVELFTGTDARPCAQSKSRCFFSRRSIHRFIPFLSSNAKWSWHASGVRSTQMRISVMTTWGSKRYVSCARPSRDRWTLECHHNSNVQLLGQTRALSLLRELV